ncbi:YslB family protein [Virgibacillus senegalensis]|uniref:YslB family protein n=1 Tax=Virgibacillus senegalensis TaxID=1499679 RepID=UPI00069EAAAD|nr:YslB family protein [Virgibacillus senegalensis]
MGKNRQIIDRTTIDGLHTSGAGYDILRYICLPDLLGKEASPILYIMGKNLARKMQLSSVEEVIDFFDKLGWGHLQLIKEKRREMIWELTAEHVQLRHQANLPQVEYRLEAGFLAEAMQQIKGVPCEGLEEAKSKNSSVQFNIVYTK